MSAGCAGPVVIDEEPVPGSGYVWVTFDVENAGTTPADVSSIEVGGVRVLDLQDQGDGTVLGMVQGGDDGPADVLIRAAGGALRFEDELVYQGPDDARLNRLMAFGASLGEGVQGGTPTYRGGLIAPSALIAGQTRSRHALPLLKRDLLPQIGVADIGPAPACTVPSVTGFVADAAVDVVINLKHPDTGVFDFAAARLDADLPPDNISTGSFKLTSQLNGPDDFAQTFLAHLVYEPVGSFGSPVETAPIELIEQSAPDVIVTFDLFGNDVIGSVVSSSTLSLGHITSLEEVRADFQELLPRLSATGAEVFISTLPRPTLLPLTKARREQVIADKVTEGATLQDATAQVDERLVEIDRRSAALDQELIDQAAAFDNIHVVEIGAVIEPIDKDGMVIGDQTVGTGKFGGLLSTDGVHFSDTGYAVLANAFIEAIDGELGTTTPRVDLAAVLEADPYSPNNLRAAGLDIDACDGVSGR